MDITRMCCQRSLRSFLFPVLLFPQCSVVLKAVLSGDHSGAGTLVPTSKQLYLCLPSGSTQSVSVYRWHGQAYLLNKDCHTAKICSVFLRVERESSIPKVDRA